MQMLLQQTPHVCSCYTTCQQCCCSRKPCRLFCHRIFCSGYSYSCKHDTMRDDACAHDSSSELACCQGHTQREGQKVWVQRVPWSACMCCHLRLQFLNNALPALTTTAVRHLKQPATAGSSGCATTTHHGCTTAYPTDWPRHAARPWQQILQICSIPMVFGIAMTQIGRPCYQTGGAGIRLGACAVVRQISAHMHADVAPAEGRQLVVNDSSNQTWHIGSKFMMLKEPDMACTSLRCWRQPLQCRCMHCAIDDGQTIDVEQHI